MKQQAAAPTAQPGQRVSAMTQNGEIWGTVAETWIGDQSDGSFYKDHQICFVNFDNGMMGCWRTVDLILI